MKEEQLRLYVITDDHWQRQYNRTLMEEVKQALDGGVTMLQLRSKHATEDELAEQALSILPLCRAAGVPLIINDRWKVALDIGADGAHIGQGDGNLRSIRANTPDGFILGATAHNLEEALRAQEDGADYLGVGAAFGSKTKTDAKPIELSEYKRITHCVNIPVVAIGGIDEGNVKELQGSGIAGIAVISAILGYAEIRPRTENLKRLSEDLFA